jgi:hypothetical protein
MPIRIDRSEAFSPDDEQWAQMSRDIVTSIAGELREIGLLDASEATGNDHCILKSTGRRTPVRERSGAVA